MKYSKIEQLVLLILDRAHKQGMADLSKFQIFKITYLLQVMAIKYAGVPLLPGTTFVRNTNGPISVDLYNALENLEIQGLLKKSITKKEDYKYPRHGYRIAKKLPKLYLSKGEVIFADNFIAKLLPLTHNRLKDLAYATEPMRKIVAQEKGELKKGTLIDFSLVTVDPDTVDGYSDG
ncbi:MAG TPA: type II toxin-antitoxin system antitoxin SocA domain-containing protein [Candidatus Paceibacterota bacterium]|nr:type II toxin-antitoxin system antitoxin SocA domain-containing protein [Candidatus Paceibacterota bacterium]